MHPHLHRVFAVITSVSTVVTSQHTHSISVSLYRDHKLLREQTVSQSA